MNLKGSEIRTFYEVGLPIPTGPSGTHPAAVTIPLYQRPYRWGASNVEKLLKDWEGSVDQSYFAGAIVSVNDENNSRHQLVDGQQRFTTIYLSNFLLFCTLRVCIRHAINHKEWFDINGLINEFERSASHLIDCKSSSESVRKFNEKIKDYSRLGPKATQKQKEQMLKDTQEILGIPLIERDSNDPNVVQEINEGVPQYDSKHTKSVAQYLSAREIRLKYSRPAFNDCLKTVLESTIMKMSDQSQIELAFDDGGNFNEQQDVYKTALKTVFNFFFEKHGQQANSYEQAKAMAEDIKRFLSEVQLCVIQTGKAGDAYTLFEVLNDRSLALEDLDLIKNYFYKTFVTTNADLSEEKIDQCIEDLDKQWTENIFLENDAAEKKKLVNFLAIVFIANSKEAKHDDSRKNRAAISNYLDKRYSKSIENGLNEELIKKYFNIFQCCSIAVNLAELKFGKARKSSALFSRHKNDESDFRVASAYFLASDQQGVFVGLICYFLFLVRHQFESKYGASGAIYSFDPIYFEKELKIQVASASSQLNSAAKTLMQWSLYAPSAEAPREQALKLLNHCHVNADTAITLPSVNSTTSKVREEFRDWASTWSYGGNDFKIRFLFCHLIRLNLDSKGHVVSAAASLQLPKEEIHKLQLDHLEPRKPDKTKADAYFVDRDRDLYINGLGNMMPLPAKDNLSKSDKPMEFAGGHLEDAGFDSNHILHKDFIAIYDKNKDKKNVPKKKFFQQRKEKIIERFIEAIEL